MKRLHLDNNIPTLLRSLVRDWALMVLEHLNLFTMCVPCSHVSPWPQTLHLHQGLPHRPIALITLAPSTPVAGDGRQAPDGLPQRCLGLRIAVAPV